MLASPLLLLLAAPLAPSDIHVDPVFGDDLFGLGTPEAPLQSITTALTMAGPGDVLLLAPGGYSVSSGESFPLALPLGVTVRSKTNRVLTRIQAGPNQSAFEVVADGSGPGDTSVLEGLTIVEVGNGTDNTALRIVDAPEGRPFFTLVLERVTFDGWDEGPSLSLSNGAVGSLLLREVELFTANQIGVGGDALAVEVSNGFALLSVEDSSIDGGSSAIRLRNTSGDAGDRIQVDLQTTTLAGQAINSSGLLCEVADATFQPQAAGGPDGRPISVSTTHCVLHSNATCPVGGPFGPPPAFGAAIRDVNLDGGSVGGRVGHALDASILFSNGVFCGSGEAELPQFNTATYSVTGSLLTQVEPYDGSGLGSNRLLTTTPFVDFGARDFHLTRGSEARDLAGTAWPALSGDIDGDFPSSDPGGAACADGTTDAGVDEYRDFAAYVTRLRQQPGPAIELEVQTLAPPASSGAAPSYACFLLGGIPTGVTTQCPIGPELAAFLILTPAPITVDPASGEEPISLSLPTPQDYVGVEIGFQAVWIDLETPGIAFSRVVTAIVD